MPSCLTAGAESGEGPADLALLEREVHRQDQLGDRGAAARARLALGCALLAQDDPRCREILEDVGTWFEENGDEAAVLAVDDALRSAAAVIEESPASFQASSHRKSVPAMRVT
jgi:hypothetical protein